MVSTSTPPPAPPPPAYDDVASAAPIDLKLVADPAGKDVLITVIPPATPSLDGDEKADIKTKRPPVDFVLTIDVSGSMGTNAPAPGENENTGLCVLDVVKHAAKTIVVTMRPDDRVAIVTFDSNADTILPLTATDEQGKKKAMELLDGLKIGDSTNLWDGLKTSMNILTGDTQGKESSGSSSPRTGAMGALLNASSSIIQGVAGLRRRSPSDTAENSTTTTAAADANAEEPAPRLSSIFLLTDGLPNVVPPRGHIPMLKRYLESYPPEKTNFTINTFGFGYSLDSPLLHQIAKIGNGHFGFIPDSGMVGTVFVHAVANTYATYAEGLFVDVEVEDESVARELVVTGSFDFVRSSWGIQIPLGNLQYGQTKDLVVKLPRSLSKAPLSITARCHPYGADGQTKVTRAISDSMLPLANSPVDPNLLYHGHRMEFLTQVFALFPWKDKEADSWQMSRQSNSAPPDAPAKFETIVAAIKASFPDAAASGSSTPSPASDALDLATDIDGQVLLGVKNDGGAFSRWGRHYLLSLGRSHQRQQCGNFKDPGLLVYGRDSKLFVACRDEIDKAFDDLPPPTPRPAAPMPMPGQLHRGHVRMARVPGAPSARAMMGSVMPSVKSMSVYNSRAAPCFAGQSRIELAGGEAILVEKLRIGQAVKTPIGSARVIGIVTTVIQAGALELCEMGDGLLITPWHPVHIDSKWAFPADLAAPKVTECNAVYSILLEANPNSDAHAVFIGGVRCVTLGHGVTEGDVRAHPFLSNHAGVLLELLKGASGLAYRAATGIKRDTETGLMCNFVWADEDEDVAVLPNQITAASYVSAQA